MFTMFLRSYKLLEIERRTLHDLGDLRTGCPVDLLVTYSSHYCSTCRQIPAD